MRLNIPILLPLLYLVSCSPKYAVTVDYAFEEDNHLILKSQLNDSLFVAMEGRHVKKGNRTIKTRKKAMELARLVLLKEFGDDYITRDGQNTIKERFYTVHSLH